MEVGMEMMEVARASDLKTFKEVVGGWNFRDTDEIPLKERFADKGPFMWFDIYKQSTERTLKTGPFLRVVNEIVKRWWVLKDDEFEGFVYDSDWEKIFVTDKMEKGVHNIFWEAFWNADSGLP